MRAIRFVGPEKIAHLDLPDPQPVAGEVIVRVQASDSKFIERLLEGDRPR